MNYIASLTKDMQATVLGIRKDIREGGVETFEYLNTRHLYKKIWEIKISQERIMYVLKDADSVYFLHMCKKQKGKAEKKDIDLAKSRAKELGLL